MLDLKQEYKITYYYLVLAGALLFFLKFVISSTFAYLVDYFITFLPFVIVIFGSFWGFYQYNKHPEKKKSIEKHTLFNIFYLLLITLGFYIFYSPTSFAIIVQSFKNLVRVLDPENFFILLSYLSIGLVGSTLIFYFWRVYQKSSGAYQGSLTILGKKCLYSVFFVLLFMSSSSVLAFPDSYKPMVDLGSDLIYTLTAGNVQISKFDGTANQRINSLKKVSDSLSQTYQNLSQNVSDSNKKLSDTLNENKATLNDTIAQTNKTLKNNLSNDFDDKLNAQEDDLRLYIDNKVEAVSFNAGGNMELSGSLTVSGDVEFSGLHSGLLKAGSNGALSNATSGTDYESPLAFSGPLSRSENTIGLDYQSTNLKLTSGKLNTIQDISTSSSPTFYNGIYNGNLNVKGTGNSYFKGRLSVGTTSTNGLFQVNSSDTFISSSASVAEASATYEATPVGNVGTFSETQTVLDDTGFYPNYGGDHSIKVYAYKEIDGVRYYSSVPAQADSSVAEGASNYYIVWSWEAVDGADGYRVVKMDNISGYQFDAFHDTSTNSIIDGQAGENIWDNSTFSLTPNHFSQSGEYFNNGNSHAIKVYAYRTVSGTRYYSQATSSNTFIDSNESDKNYYLTWSWDAVEGAEGYRVLKYDSKNSYNYDYYFDITSNSFTDGNGTMSWSSGSTVTPTGGTVGTSFIVGNNGNVGINTDTPLALLDVNGVGVHGIGSAASPSFAFRSDLNTGMWSAGSDTINFSTNGLERWRLDSAGNVGIGTSSPSQRLSVAVDEADGGVVDVLSLLHTKTDSASSSGFAGAESLSSGLVGYWKMDESSGTTVADNKSTFSGTSPSSSNITTGKIGMSRTFSGGSSSYISLGNNTALAPAKLTFSAWIYPTAANDGTIFGRYTSHYVYFYLSSLRKVNVLISTNGTSAWTGIENKGSQISLNAWHHVAMTYDGATIKIYVDGALDSSVAYSGAFSNSLSGTTEIGRRPVYNDTGFTGRIDEAGLWSRAITASEITSLYNAGNGLTYESEASDLGTAMLFQGENSGGNIFGSSRINSAIFSNTAGSETSSLVFENIINGTMAERMRIDGSGNIGIGTTSPTYKLDVNGTGRFSGALTVSTLSSNGAVYSNAGVLTNTNPSDERLKKNIEGLGSVLPNLMQLRPVSFAWKSNGEEARGFIAQEVEKVFPELVGEGLNGYKGLFTDQFIPYLTKAIQEQQQEIQTQSTSIAGVELKTSENVTTISDLKNSIDDQLKKISDDFESNKEIISKQNETNIALQNQIDELKSRTNQDLNLAQMEANTEDLNYLKTLLGITDTTNPGDLKLIGSLTAESILVNGLETMQLTVKNKDEDSLTIGESMIKAVKTDEDDDGVDDETDLTGTKVFVKTKAVRKNSRIFVTASEMPEVKGEYKLKKADGDTETVTIEMNEPLYIGDIDEGKGFEVRVAHPVKEDTEFHWWLVEDGNEQP